MPTIEDAFHQWFNIHHCAQTSATAPTVTVGHSNTMKTITVTVTKPSKATKLGLGVGRKAGHSGITVKELQEGSLFANSDLKVGCRIVSINGKQYASFAEGLELMKKAEGKLVIVAQMRSPPHGPSHAPPIFAASITTAVLQPYSYKPNVKAKLSSNCHDSAARNWSKFGNQTPKFEVAVCECFTKGFSVLQVVKYILQSEYADEEDTDKKLYMKVYNKVYNISKSWKKSESAKMMAKTTQAVKQLPVTMNVMDKENIKPHNFNNADLHGTEPILVTVMKEGLKKYNLKKNNGFFQDD